MTPVSLLECIIVTRSVSWRGHVAAKLCRLDSVSFRPSPVIARHRSPKCEAFAGPKLHLCSIEVARICVRQESKPCLDDLQDDIVALAPARKQQIS